MIMSCCGGNRTRAVMPASVSSSPQPVQPVYTPPATLAIFRYEGEGTLTVIGPATGRKYWFERNGAELAVDLRDRNAVAKVPKVRQVRMA
jgi:hypothetical protein